MLVCGCGLAATKAGSVYFLHRHLDTSRIHEKEKKSKNLPFSCCILPRLTDRPIIASIRFPKHFLRSCTHLAFPPPFPVRLIGQQPEGNTKKRQFYGKLGARNLVPGVSLWNWGGLSKPAEENWPKLHPLPYLFSFSSVFRSLSTCT